MRLWPRGVRKTSIDIWMRDLGTSRGLIQEWKAGKVTWTQFKTRYRREMKGDAQKKLLEKLASYARSEPVTLLCSCRDPTRCHRAILKELVEALVTG